MKMKNRISLNNEEFAVLKQKWSKRNLVKFILSPGVVNHGDDDALGRGTSLVPDFPIEDTIELHFKTPPILFDQPFIWPIETEIPTNESVVFTTNNFFWKYPISHFKIDMFLSNFVVEEPYIDSLKVMYDGFPFHLQSISVINDLEPLFRRW